ncbi:MAG: geranylgeranylglycerol-phosphate geranylgeranyltransferase [Candidatus Cloacimonetes bacterium]|nr:geranylgeranylglycerol-phosphate geranylgeranyltransferase [Candidatus Cloacimonadota bacterium]
MSLISYFKITRPFNIFFVAISVLFGAYWKTNFDFSNLIFPVLAALSASFIAAAGYVINDFFDIEIDKINKPKRAIPSGKISPISAKNFAILMFIFGIIISFIFKNLWMILLASCNSILLWIYAYKAKKLTFLDNILVSFFTASAFLYGGLANENIANSYFIFFCAFVFTIIREIVKDLEDIKGDKKNNAKTIPIIFGKNVTFVLLFLFWIFLTILTIFGYERFYEISVFAILILLVGFFIPINLSNLFLKFSKKKASFSSKMMKVNMFVILLVLWFSQYF